MNAARPLAVCIALAVGAHAALLLRAAPGAAPHPDHPGSAALSVRLQPADEPAAAVAQPDTTEATAASPAPEAPARTPAAARSTSTSDEGPPSFEGEPPGIGFPDAPLPDGGAAVRAHLVLDEQGMAQNISTAAAPGQPVGFQKMAELALRQARLHAPAGTRYCLLVRFEPGAPEGKLAWLPGAAQDAARCLAGALPAPREIEASPAP